MLNNIFNLSVLTSYSTTIELHRSTKKITRSFSRVCQSCRVQFRDTKPHPHTTHKTIPIAGTDDIVTN